MNKATHAGEGRRVIDLSVTTVWLRELGPALQMPRRVSFIAIIIIIIIIIITPSIRKHDCRTDKPSRAALASRFRQDVIAKRWEVIANHPCNNSILRGIMDSKDIRSPQNCLTMTPLHGRNPLSSAPCPILRLIPSHPIPLHPMPPSMNPPSSIIHNHPIHRPSPHRSPSLHTRHRHIRDWIPSPSHASPSILCTSSLHKRLPLPRDSHPIHSIHR